MPDIFELFDQGLKTSKADQTELVCENEEFYLTRFAENTINGNIGRNDHTVWCRAIIGKKIGIAKTNILSRESISELIDTAVEICSQQQEDPKFQSLVKSPAPGESHGFFKATADYTALQRAEAIKAIVDIARSNNLDASGMFQTSQTMLTVANSLGTRNQGRTTEARLSITLSGDNDRAGFAQACSRDVGTINYADIANRAVAKAARSRKPISLSPGQYTVLLDPEAVADFLLFLGFLGFGGKGMVSQRSFMAGKIGEKIMSDNVTIVEDPENPIMSYIPFDYEGVPRQRVTIIENGIAKGAVHDSYYAAQAGTKSTGNALPPDNTFGPYPKAMVMTSGGLTLNDLIASTKRAVYVGHFWYLNFVNPMRTLVTGTTRDGTFLVEDGAVVSPVTDMRIMQSMLESFNNVEAISSDRRLVYKYGVLMYVPAMRLSNFNFVSSE